MKKIAFLSSGCQNCFGQARDIITANPNCREVSDPSHSDILMVNFCAMSTKNLNDFERFRHQITQYKKSNPNLKILAGGCIEGLAEKKDLGFADVIFPHQAEAATLATFLGKDTQPALAPTITNGVAIISIAQGCNRRCSFCKVHFLDHMQLTSRPLEEILDLAQQALAKSVHVIALSAENSTEYGIDIGTNLQTLLERLLAFEDLHILDVHGLCLDEVTPELLQTLQHPKIRMLQLEVQSLNDKIRANMNLHKTTKEALAILDALSPNKFLVSNFMTGFPGHSISEFDKEMRLVRSHHLYFLSLDAYDDTPGTPSHDLYMPVAQTTNTYYHTTFLCTIGKERQLLLERLTKKDAIEATITAIDDDSIYLCASHYAINIIAEQTHHYYHPGDLVRVKITGVHDYVSCLPKSGFANTINIQDKRTMNALRYFDVTDKNQTMLAEGEIIGPIL